MLALVALSALAMRGWRPPTDPPLCNLADCVPETAPLVECPSSRDGLGAFWRIRGLCPVGAMGYVVNDPDTGEVLHVTDALASCDYVYRICPWAAPPGEP